MKALGLVSISKITNSVRILGTKKIHSGVILSGIYSRIFTRVDSLFRAVACTLCFSMF